VGEALGADLTQLGADLDGDLGLHQLVGDQCDRLAHEVAVLARHDLGDDVGSSHSVAFGHRGVSSHRLFAGTDESGCRGGRILRRPTRCSLHHFYRRDPRLARRLARAREARRTVIIRRVAFCANVHKLRKQRKNRI